MYKKLQVRGALLLAAMAAAAVMPLAPKAAAADAAPVTMTVTAVGKKDTQPPPLTRNDVQLYQGRASASGGLEARRDAFPRVVDR